VFYIDFMLLQLYCEIKLFNNSTMNTMPKIQSHHITGE